jgi:SAM-dependent methyltransferase
MNEKRKLSEESDRFSFSGDSHDLPEIANWFSHNILSHELLKHTGSNSFQDLVLQGIRNSRKSDNEFVLVSLGAGHGQIENELLKIVPRISPGNTHFYAIDLFSPNDSIETHVNGSTYRLTRVSQDLNNPTFPKNADMVIVHHALHHFVALEEIFKSIYQILLVNSGTLIIADMVGRNGHMRWQESLRAINRIWNYLPVEKKYNNQFHKIINRMDIICFFL